MLFKKKRFKNLEIIFKNRYFSFVIIGILGLAAYAIPLLMGIPDGITAKLQAREATGICVAIFLFLYLAFVPKGWLGRLTSFSATLGLFALPLAALWRSGIGESGFVLSGMLAMSDTDAYHTSALRLLEGDTFNPIGSWRPLSHGLVAILLGFTQQDIQLSTALLVLITAISCYLLAWELRNNYGVAASVLVLTLIFLFAKKYIGTVSTENLGIAVGSIGLASLLHGISKQKENWCLLGIFLLSLALNIRVGVLLILPTLVLWGAWSFKRTSRLSYRFLLIGGGLVLLGFIINSIVLKVVGFSGVMGNSNFSYTLYGSIIGGNWQTVLQKYPELSDMNNPENARKIYQLALNAFLANPLMLLWSILKGWKIFFIDGVVFSFVKSLVVQVSLQILGLLTLIYCFGKRNTLITSFLIAAFVGIILSLPFAPPYEGGNRIYAATVPLFSFFAAFSLTGLIEKIQWLKQWNNPTTAEYPALLSIIGIVLTIILLIGPIIIRVLSQPPQYTEIACPVGTEAVYFHHTSNSLINILPDGSRQKSYLPNFQVSDFRKTLAKYESNYGQLFHEIPNLVKELSAVEPNNTLIRKINLKTGKTLWLIADSALIPKDNGIVGACGHSSINADFKATAGYLRYLFYANSIQLLSS